MPLAFVAGAGSAPGGIAMGRSAGDVAPPAPQLIKSKLAPNAAIVTADRLVRRNELRVPCKVLFLLAAIHSGAVRTVVQPSGMLASP